MASVFTQIWAQKKDIFVNAASLLSAGDEGPRVAQLRARLVRLVTSAFHLEK